jgi:N-acetylmuramoyl-L-alanine amidase
MNDIEPTIGERRRERKRSWLRPTGVAFLLVIGSVFFSGCATSVKDTSRTFRTVVIDAGHGGRATGTSSRWAGTEKAATLDVALRLQPKLRAAGFRTVMTRTRDVDVELNERPAISNRQSNAIFVSIHFNESRARRIHGTETYYKSLASYALARRIQGAVSSLPGATSRGVKTANFRVLRLNRYPAVLVECGYFSNPAEARRCAKPEYREQIANALARAIVAQRHGG